MTKAQELALEKLVNRFCEYYSYGRPDEHELKEKHVEEWEECGGTVYVRLEMGRTGDEGTLAEVFCRDTTHVMIGKRGGYFGYRERTGKKATLDLFGAVTWGSQCERMRKLMK